MSQYRKDSLASSRSGLAVPGGPQPLCRIRNHTKRPVWIYEVQLVALLTVPARIPACAWTNHTHEGGSSNRAGPGGRKE